MGVEAVLKPATPPYPGSAPTTLVAVVPDAIDPVRLMPDLGLPALFAEGSDAIAFLWPYGGPGDHDCAALVNALEDSHHAPCGFVLPYPIQADQALDPLTGARVPLADLEAALARGDRSREPPTPNPPPLFMSHTFVDGFYMDVVEMMEMDWEDVIVAEIEVIREGPFEYNTPTGAPPPAPPDAPGQPHVDREEWDIRAVVEMKVHRVFAGDETLTDIVTLVPGNPDNPFHSTSGMEPPPLLAGMRGVVAFDQRVWPPGEPTHYQRRALARVAALTGAGRRAQLLTVRSAAGVQYVGPYALGDIYHLWRIEDLRAHLDAVARGDSDRRR